MSMLFRYFVGAIFVLAAVQKIRDPESFRRALRRYNRSLGTIRIGIVAAAVTLIEFVTGCFLLAPWLNSLSAAMAITLLLVLSIPPILSEGRFQAQQDCGCPSFLGKHLYGRQVFLRNLGLACLLVPSIRADFSLIAIASGITLLITSIGTSFLSATFRTGSRVVR